VKFEFFVAPGGRVVKAGLRDTEIKEFLIEPQIRTGEPKEISSDSRATD
jgi:hypothetical protein